MPVSKTILIHAQEGCDLQVTLHKQDMTATEFLSHVTKFMRAIGYGECSIIEAMEKTLNEEFPEVETPEAEAA